MIQKLSLASFLPNNYSFFKRITKVNLAFLVFLMLTSNSCKVNDMSLQENEYSNGVVSFADPAVDGCGWLISFKEGEYYPTNLDSGFKKEGLKVAVVYSLTGKKACAWGEINTINVHKIKLQK